MLTPGQVRRREKDVTRRLGWKKAKPRNLAQPVVKGMGLKKGEKVEKIGGPIRFTDVSWEPLRAMTDNLAYGRRECIREGFPHLTPHQFVAMFCAHNRCTPETEVTRIAFEYL